MLSDDDFRRLLDVLNRPWAGFRKVRKGVKKRVRRHMQLLGCTSLDAYLGRIKHDPLARAGCEQSLTVTISRFFRDRRLWDHLNARALPTLINRFPKGLAAWSAGCANGEEPYTLAMIWENLAATACAAPTMRIVATDAESSCIQRARAGLYPSSSLKEVPQMFRERWFQQLPGGRQWRIDTELQKHIGWQVHQLLGRPPQDTFHIILLRNSLLTYYQGAALRSALEGILSTLAIGGVLILGSHERLPSLNFPLDRDSACPWVYHASETMDC